LSLKSNDTESFKKACSEKGHLNRIAGTHQVNVDFADSLLSLRQVLENPALMVGAYNLLGLGQLGLYEYDKAIASFQYAIEATEADDTKYLFILMNNLGMCYYYQGN